MIALGIVATHFVSLRFDRAVEDAKSPDDAADRQEEREDRARGMRLAFAITGAVGARAALVHGDKLGQIILAAVVFGAVGVVGYLLYRGVRGIFRGARRRHSR